MRTASWCMTLVGAVAALIVMNNAAPAFAQEDRAQIMGARFERLEQRLNQLAERQERMMNRLGMAGEQQALMPPPPHGPGVEGPRAPLPSTHLNWPGPHAKMAFWKCMGLIKLVMLITFVCHILLAIWVYSDIRKRGEGNGIFIILALLAGFLGAGLYALVRIGEKKA